LRKFIELIACAVVMCAAAWAQPMTINVQYKCPVGGPIFASVEAPGGTALLHKTSCTLSGKIAGEEATHDEMLSHGIMAADRSKWHAIGMEIGYLANNDTYVAEWEENGAKTGSTISLKYTGGTGKLEGMTGKLEISCPPPADGFIVCKGTGSYTVPKPSNAGAPKNPK
jgi:hypothetical protein